MIGFGLMQLRTGGAPIHPNDCERPLSDEHYLRQLQAYADFHGLAEAKAVMTSRPHLLDQLK